MNVSIGDRWEGFVEGVVKAGRYSTASEVIREGLRLVEEREAKLQSFWRRSDTVMAAAAKPAGGRPGRRSPYGDLTGLERPSLPLLSA